MAVFNLVYYFPGEERVALFRTLRGLLATGGRLLLPPNLHSQGKYFGAAKLNLATCSIQGYIPLPQAQELCVQLGRAGFIHMPITRIVLASTYYGIAAS